MALSIAIADDHPVLLHGLRQQLQSTSRKRFEVCASVTSGQALLRSLRGLTCDLALVDWHMPAHEGPTGGELLLCLREAFPRVALVVMTASQQPTLLGACLAAGAKGLYDKRGDSEQLQRILIQAAHGKTSVSPGFEAVLERHYLSRRHWGQENRQLLSPREREVINLSAEGYSGREIAARLARSEKTISRQRRSALDKLGLHADALPLYEPSLP
ncbi:response regulator transcription factor [Pseudomonas sp. RIT-PI-S]|uniref:response regulator transcription factor n=1 Tax=Pseudomonas sp. RIT-PI-S TaxID=3035295 RepID=UPI0021DB19CB|nr:response regulator transcription factor [Pseudomonas sp. RIT-PI-S]